MAVDELFEAFFEFAYGRPYETGVVMPRSERGRLNRAVVEAEAAGITAEEVKRRGGSYVAAWRDVTRSPQGLLANWTRFAPQSPGGVPVVGGPCVEHVWAVLPEGDLCAVCQVRRDELDEEE